ncbi:phospholipid scramblase 3-like isoform X1 [Pectinophora gossypiella]|uniref:phospholipid scramblase 3-like isoform X1 n=1 Tax=Pectinophora gossypiella TaxID=13191 RepID=UPI00214F2C9B|nr:phospholipid scramblase 3-like isoform X1 [Pectinophora gossypiella]XP_049876336.1 phospholipid scramblase 3-like isoform X1 [Pectinophora gossypiella]XP_049876344.1 phospholipid scramblase 3-like isoform X1 [Pectinophora gossypiella]XP_049876353.1 phospholipid scramblase 3-like isoform X1 [Pectinophora gossypiella]XP_049876363.1 phospholipid scramblase 3-like isoform X1 [Pectinophora gossypiella]XP_049876372.1 phospholipid scramblase 3-like isoform X1 [Pectinophora gossypiella]XP_04987638
MAESSGPEPPLGITQLSSVDRVVVRQKSYAGCKYEVLTSDGRVILHARDDTTALGQLLGGTNRAFNIDVMDTQDRPIAKLRRPYTVGSDKMEVWVTGKLASVVRQEVTFLKPVLSVNDAGDKPLYRVKGPVDTANDTDFEVFSLSKKKVGAIKRKWGRSREAPADTDSFHIHFPKDLDVRYKAALVGVCFLIDFLFYGS